MTKFRKESGKQPGRAYPASVREAALRDYMSGMSRSAVSKKYSIADSTVLSHWKRKFVTTETVKSSVKMVKRRNKRLLMTDLESESADRIKELERALSKAESELKKREKDLKTMKLKLLIAETTIDIAEENFNLAIRKKFGSR